MYMGLKGARRYRWSTVNKSMVRRLCGWKLKLRISNYFICLEARISLQITAAIILRVSKLY
jgi:hypothetical protein